MKVWKAKRKTHDVKMVTIPAKCDEIQEGDYVRITRVTFDDLVKAQQLISKRYGK